MSLVKVKRALISVYNKDGLDEVINCLQRHHIEIISTGGTQSNIANMGVECTAVEDLTDYPSILGGRVKTLHPAVFGGILARRGCESDHHQCDIYDIHPIDLVIVDLYPFQETVAAGGTHEEIVEKIDVGGISLIRAAAKNYKDVVIIPTRDDYKQIVELLDQHDGGTTIDSRKALAAKAFGVTAAYDIAIHRYFSGETEDKCPYKHAQKAQDITLQFKGAEPLRYGENPHQKGIYYGDLTERFEYLQGKQLSYNNLLDVDAAVHLVEEYDTPTCAILKHNTPCGLASRQTITEAYAAALACDPISAFGGIIVVNGEVDEAMAEMLDQIFFEVLIAPSYSAKALQILQKKQKRIILRDKIGKDSSEMSYRSVLGGLLAQERDRKIEEASELKVVTTKEPSEDEKEEMLFGMKAVKYCKSNAIVLSKDRQIVGAGYGQTSRVNALKHAIEKAKAIGMDLHGAVLSSDAFFPFPDCVEIAHEAGITAIVQPGGSIKDQLSIDSCNERGIAMCFTGTRHFRH